MLKLISHVTAPAPRYMLRLAVISKLLDRHLKSVPFSFLEIGPGFGDIPAYLAEWPNCQSITTVDFSEDTTKLLTERFAGNNKINCVAGDIDSLDQDRQYDVIAAFEVLEHIEDDVSVINRIFNKLSNQGLCLVSAPAYMKKWQKQDEYAGHLRRYERDELERKLSASGFVDIQIMDYGFPLTAIMYPIRQLTYKPSKETDQTEKTKKSGTDRPFFSKMPPLLFAAIYLPFIFVQSFFYKSSLGDGFVAIARKP
jgi:SAM-dependent methyltransferase